MRIWHQHRSTYVLVNERTSRTTETRNEAIEALRHIEITEWSRMNFEPLHFDTHGGSQYLQYGHVECAEALHGYRFVDVVRPKEMRTMGWDQS